MKSGKTTTLSIVLLGAAVLLLLAVVLQLSALEQRAIKQERQLGALGEASEKLAAEIGRLKSGGLATSAALGAGEGCDVAQPLHPEVENFLSPKGVHWPPKGATLDGIVKKGWDSGDPKGFNWLVVNDGALSEYIEHYSGAVLSDRNIWTDPNLWHARMACRVEITDDFKEYTIYLRKGVYWHKPAGVDVKSARYAWLDKPQELTAEDYVFAIEMILNPQVENGFLRNYYKDVESVKAVDKHTLVVRWKTKTYQSLAFSLSVQPLAKHIYGYTEDGKPIPQETQGLRLNQHWYNNKGFPSAGEYRFSEYKPGAHIKLERDDDYPGEKPAIKDIVYPIYTDRTLGVLKLKSGELNFTEVYPGQYREEYLDWQSKPKASWPKNNPFLNGQISCEPATSPIYRYVGWNMDNPLFEDTRVRRAMTHALNRVDILKKVFVGLGELTTGPFLPWSDHVDKTIQPLPFDLGRSRALLAEAGWKDSDGDGLVDKLIDGKRTPFAFTLLVYGNKPEYTAMANIFKEDLLKVGVKMDMAAVEWSLMQKRMEEKNFEAYTGGWLVPWDGDPFQTWHSSQADVPKGSNRIGFRNQRADKLIEQLRATFDPAKRREMFHELHRILHEEQPYTFFFYQKEVYCWRDNVKGVKFAKARPAWSMFPWWATR